MIFHQTSTTRTRHPSKGQMTSLLNICCCCRQCSQLFPCLQKYFLPNYSYLENRYPALFLVNRHFSIQSWQHLQRLLLRDAPLCIHNISVNPQAYDRKNLNDFGLFILSVFPTITKIFIQNSMQGKYPNQKIYADFTVLLIFLIVGNTAKQ